MYRGKYFILSTPNGLMDKKQKKPKRPKWDESESDDHPVHEEYTKEEPYKK